MTTSCPLFFFLSFGHDGFTASQQLDVLASDGSLFALGGPGIGFSLHYHEKKKRGREREIIKLYFGEGGD